MSIVRTRTHQNPDGEVLQLPLDFAFGADVELLLFRSGDVLTVYPATLAPTGLMPTLDGVPPPPSVEERDVAELPERESL